MPTPSPKTEFSLRALFDEIAELPSETRAAKVAALNLPEGAGVTLIAMLAFDDLFGTPIELRQASATALNLPEAVSLRLQEMFVIDSNSAGLRQALAADAAEILCDDHEDALSQSLIGSHIGTFRLLELIGEGGSSTVFRAEREVGDGLQIVALKLLRTGVYSMDAQRRFRREQAILAQLTHANIARLIEGGVSSFGIPYIAMELVDGVPITHAAHARSLNVAQRLAWFCTLCRAIEAAHRALIVHRDLKPSNLLVTREGDLKVLDFGIAKLLDHEDATTRTQQIALTPEYAAPEQFGTAALTTAVDVYALGMILAELLTGKRPSGRTRANSLLSAIGDGSPLPSGLPPRRMLVQQLRGDLDAVLAKALAEEPARRYGSAGAFADDIERYLAGQPVRAHQPSRWYWMHKFVVRHRVGVLVAALVVIAVLSSLAMAVWQARIARQEAARANTVRDFVVGVFDAARASLPRDQRPTPESLVTKASAQLDSANTLDAATRADLDRTLGEVWLSLSSFAAADTAFGRALEYAVLTGDQETEAGLRVLQADGWQRVGRNADALRALEPLLIRLRVRPLPVLIRALHVVAAAEMAMDMRSQALAHQREAAALTAQQYGNDEIETVAANLEVGGALVAAGSFTEAIDLIEPELTKWRRLHAPEDDRYVRGLNNLMDASDALGRYDDSEARVREIIEIKRRIYTAPHEAIASSLRDLAAMLDRKGDHGGAEALLGEAISMQRALFGENHVEVAASLDMLGFFYATRRLFSEAERHYLDAIAICERAQIRGDICSRVHNNLGQAYYAQDRLADAEREMQIALSERRRLYGESHPYVAQSMSTLANVAALHGEIAKAVELSARAVALFEQAGHGQSRETALARNGYADVLERAGRHDEALDQIDRALIEWTRMNPDGKVRRVIMLALKGQILRSLGRIDQVRNVLREARAIDASPSALTPFTRKRLQDLDQYTATRDQ